MRTVFHAREGNVYLPPALLLMLSMDYGLTDIQLGALARIASNSVNRSECSPRGYSRAVVAALERGLLSGELSLGSLTRDDDLGALRLAYVHELLQPHREFLRPDNGRPNGGDEPA